MLVSKWRKTDTDTEHSLYCLPFFQRKKDGARQIAGTLSFFAECQIEFHDQSPFYALEPDSDYSFFRFLDQKWSR